MNVSLAGLLAGLSVFASAPASALTWSGTLVGHEDDGSFGGGLGITGNPYEPGPYILSIHFSAPVTSIEAYILYEGFERWTLNGQTVRTDLVDGASLHQRSGRFTSVAFRGELPRDYVSVDESPPNTVAVRFNWFSDGFYAYAEPNQVINYTVEFRSLTVPEPTSWALMILGFGASGTMLRRHRFAA